MADKTYSIRNSKGDDIPIKLHDNGDGTYSFGTNLADLSNGDYEPVAASKTKQVLGTTGAVGDYIAGLLVIPATTSPGAITLSDLSDDSPASESIISIFVGGVSSVATLDPFLVPLGWRSKWGSWRVTTGANVSVVASGNFT